MADAIAKFIRKNGRLASFWPLVSWAPGEAVVVLDGEFSPAVLRAIAAHIEERRPVPWPYLARSPDV